MSASQADLDALIVAKTLEKPLAGLAALKEGARRAGVDVGMKRPRLTEAEARATDADYHPTVEKLRSASEARKTHAEREPQPRRRKGAK